MCDDLFVPASRLYNVDSRTPIAHPADQATDEQFRRALDEREIRADGGHALSGTYRIAHLYADTGIEDEVLATFGEVTRVGIDPTPNPFSEVLQADARNPPLKAGTFDLTLLHPPCQKFSLAGGEPDDHEDLIDDARQVGSRIADHYIIENVPQAPLRDPVVLNGKHFGKPVHYSRAFETTFHVAPPTGRSQTPQIGLLEEQGKTGNAWVGKTDGWRLSKGYTHDWPSRPLKRHGIPRAYIEHLLYYWLAAREDGARSKQTTLLARTDGGNSRQLQTNTEPDDGGSQ